MFPMIALAFLICYTGWNVMDAISFLRKGH